MSFTAGLLLVFLNVFLPGLIFLRSYFKGEFSKQFNTRVPIIRLAFYSLIPGLVFFILSICIYPLFNTQFQLSGSLEIYRNLLSTDDDLNSGTKQFLNNQLWHYLIFLVITYLSSGILGVFFHYLVRKWNLDKRYKILRFKNYWYYIFSGEIAKFKKFEDAITSINIKGLDNHSDVLLTYADILVDECGKSKLYTGYVMDYELDHENIHALDKIYLLDAHKYNSISAEKKQFRFQDGFVKKMIPGHLFVIDYKKVLNLNLTYVPSLNHLWKRHLKKEKKFEFFGWVFILIFVLLLLLPVPYIWFLDTLSFNFLYSLSVIEKVFLTLSALSIFNFLFFIIEKYRLESRRDRLVKLQNDINSDDLQFNISRNERPQFLNKLRAKKLQIQKSLIKAREFNKYNWIAIILYVALFLVFFLLF